jgi:dihydroxyacetone kinase
MGLMRRLSNDPNTFADDAVRGFVSAHAGDILPVNGGVLSARVAGAPAVAVVVGGGSGHYPAFGGFVGPGMAAGAALGNVFASPSTRQIETVARAADQGRGVLFVYGNYAGDVLNFDEAQERLVATGVDVATVRVTDDISSGPASDPSRRRGVAGDLVVMKIAGAAAWGGRDLATVMDAAARANAATRTLGVAFSGCTLPGSATPLFVVPDGTMAVGMGIHGEPGVSEVETMTAEDLAALLARSLLAERPYGTDGWPVVAILNGLGSTKNEELYVLWAAVERELDVAGVEIASVEVGEFVTSFDMAGISLTLSWLPSDLLPLWNAPVDTPAYRRGGPVAGSVPRPAGVRAEETPEARQGRAAGGANPGAALILELAVAVDERVAAIEHELGRLDAIAGDGDHGIGMRRGTQAAVDAAQIARDGGLDATQTLTAAADAWGDRAGGTSGALWSTGLRELARQLPEQGGFTSEQVAAAVSAAAAAIQARGGARPGDKTMVDALVPFAETFTLLAPSGAAAALRSAAVAAEAGAAGTVAMKPGLGRARTHQARSVGTADPGAVSFAAIVTTIADYWEKRQ